MGVFVKRGEGMLLNETLGIIIAVVAMLILVFAGVKLYDVFVTNEARNAIKLMDSLEGKINTLEEGQSNTFAFRGLEGWALYGWSLNQQSGVDSAVSAWVGVGSKPDKCFFDSCICVCKGASTCQNEGICRSFDVATLELGPILSYTRIVGTLQEHDLYEYGAMGEIVLKDALFELAITKGDDSIALYDPTFPELCTNLRFTSGRVTGQMGPCDVE